MSLRAILWALDEAPCESSTERLILVYLADYADDQGCGVFPALQTVADRGGMSRATVKRHVQAMAGRGLLMPGDDRLVSHYRADRRPKVWDLAMDDSPNSRGIKMTPRRVTGDQNRSNGGSKLAERGIIRGPQTINKPINKPLGVNTDFSQNGQSRGAPKGATPPDPIDEEKAGPLPIEAYPSAVADCHCPRCGAEPGEQCTRYEVPAVLPCGERFAASRQQKE